MSTFIGHVQRLEISGYIGLPGLPRSATISSFGPFQEHDIGKRVYCLAPGVYQMENDEQLAARMKKTQTWRIALGIKPATDQASTTGVS